MIHATLLSNNVLFADVSDRELKCPKYGKDTKVLVLFLTTNAVTETHFVAFIAVQLHKEALSHDVLAALRNLKHWLLSSDEYKYVHGAY